MRLVILRAFIAIPRRNHISLFRQSAFIRDKYFSRLQYLDKCFLRDVDRPKSRFFREDWVWSEGFVA